MNKEEIYNDMNKDQLVETIKKFKNSCSKLIELNREKDKKIGELSALLATVQYRIGDNYKGREK